MEDEVIDFVDLYVFDKQDQFIELKQVDIPTMSENYKIDVPQYYKGKTLVVWAGERRGSYTTPKLNAGDNIDLLTLELITKDNISTQKLANLFHGGREIMTFDNINKAHSIYLTRTDNMIDLSLKNEQNKGIEIEGKYDIKLTAGNGRYSNDHTIIPNSPSITYMPTNYVLNTKQETKTETKRAHLHTLRLHELYNKEVKLTIYNRELEQYITFGGEQELKLIEYLLKTKPNEISNQAYLDNKSKWDISFTIDKDTSENKDIALSITINGWVISFNNIEL
jgi:hypothetical protein